MRIVLTTLGSLGDLHPYVALGIALRARGHEVVLATSGLYREKIERAGLAFHPMRPDIDALQRDPDIMRRIMSRTRGGETIFREIVVPNLRAGFEDLAEACRGADLLVGHVLTWQARLLSEKTGIPWVSTVLQPIGFFSAHDPPVLPVGGFLGRMRFLGPRFHRAAFRMMRPMVRPWSREWHRFRAELGLPPSRDEPILEGQHSPRLVLAMFSRWLAAPQPDWPPSTVTTGFLYFDDDGVAGLPPDLARFLDAGPPPVVFTLGSSAVHDPGRFYEHGAEVARRLGLRSVLLVGREPRWKPSALPEGCAVSPYAPYSLLFPRCAAIVHQGGVGTTAQSLRAGKPMLVMPFSHDQPDNAARVTRLGIARTLPRNASASRMTRDLRTILSDDRFAARAASLGEKVRVENGPAAAVDAIERAMPKARVDAGT